MKIKIKVTAYFILLTASLFFFTSKSKAAVTCNSDEIRECVNQQYKVQNAQDTENLSKNEALCTSKSNSSYVFYVPNMLNQGGACPDRQFLCCGKASDKAPSNCTQEGPCKGKNHGDDCVLPTSINGETAGVCGTVTGSGGTTGGCFCWPKAQNQPAASNTNTATNDTSQGVATSSCATGNETDSTGPQTGCTHTGDTDILNTQCVREYGANKCGSMGDYLYNLKQSCTESKPQGIDCNAITQNGFYGREATNMADYLETSGSGSPSPSNKPTMTPGLTSGGKCGAGFEEIAGVCFPSSTNLPNPSGGVAQIISNILNWLLGIFGFLAIIAFIISGVQYILSTGKEKAIDTAKRNMYGSMIGVAVALSGLIIIYAIDKMLRGTPSF
ncbi:MAG: pilin [bacterium]|nr:pilin [bacterium]